MQLEWTGSRLDHAFYNSYDSVAQIEGYVFYKTIIWVIPITSTTEPRMGDDF